MRLRVLRNTSQKFPKSIYFTSTFTHDLPHAKGPVDVIYLPPRSGNTPSRVIVFLPGNPGLIGYYTSFLKYVQDLIDPSYAIIGLSHLGHCPAHPHPARPLSLSEQIDAKCEFVQVLRDDLLTLQAEVVPEAGNEGKAEREAINISLMGHSVGAEICVQVMRRLEDPSPIDGSDSAERSLRISALFLLFPTLANIGRTPNGRRLRPIFNFPLIQLLPVLAHVLKPVLWMLSLLQPSPARKSTPSIYAPNPTTLSFLNSPPTISHILHLARSEMSTILNPDLEYYARPDVKERVWAYFGHRDGWVGDEANELKEVLRKVTGATDEHVQQAGPMTSFRGESRRSELERLVDCVDGIPHAFCLGDSHTMVVAERVAKFVREAV